MTENKRFSVKNNWIKDNCIGKLLNIDFNTITDANLCCDLLNQIEDEKKQNGKIASKFLEENKELQFQCNLLREQANEFHRGARENANRVGQLKRENKELKEILKHTYEIHECETCKHNENFNWLDPATMNREYDSRCGKGLHYGDEVHDCEEYELDLEMFKKRVKR